ncbi:MAG: hypothetical protein IIX44_06840 [Clostridia bacterium]|nr:hypothetical protein [Clostridia bacterium]
MDKDLRADKENLSQAFEKYLPNRPNDVEIGANYGHMEGNEIRIYSKKAARSFKIFAHDMLVAKIDDEGNIDYAFKRDIESMIFTVFAPIFMLIFGCGLGAGILQIYEMLLWAIPAAAFLLCNLIKPKKQREDLLDCLLRLVELSNK